VFWVANQSGDFGHGRGDGIAGEMGGFHPADISRGFIGWKSFREGTLERLHGYMHVGKLMFFDWKLTVYLNAQAKVISQRASDYFSFLTNLPGNFFFKHHDGKLPEAGQKTLSFFPVDEIPAILLDQSDGPNLFSDFFQGAFFSLNFQARPGAKTLDRALRASRMFRDTDQSAQVHQRLVESRGLPGGNEFPDGVFQHLFLAGR